MSRGMSDTDVAYGNACKRDSRQPALSFLPLSLFLFLFLSRSLSLALSRPLTSRSVLHFSLCKCYGMPGTDAAYCATSV
eukprot:169965-Rhodomonas_salina.2